MEKQTIYITEPDVIDIKGVEKVLENKPFELMRGDTKFSGDIPQNCTTLIIRSATTIASDIKQYFPHLKSIIRIGTGLDAIDLDYCKEHDIDIYNSPGANADAVSDYVVGMMLYALRRLHTLQPGDIQTWNRFKFTGRNMSKQRIGIVGFGNIGRLVYEKLAGFNCDAFFVYDPFVAQADAPEGVTVTSLEVVLQECDIVTLHLPLTPATRYCINEKMLDRMKDNSILLNASRGGIVKEEAVMNVPESKNFVYIADAVEGEPHVNTKLAARQNVIITPHMASLTESSEEDMIRVALTNFLQGKRVAG